MPDNPENTILNALLDEKEFHRVKVQLVDHAGISYIDFKKRLTPLYHKVWEDIAIGWIVITAVLTTVVLVPARLNTGLHILLMIAAAVIIGYFIAYLINFFHEAAHFNIAVDKNLNDRLANIFLGVFIAQGIKNYRIVHWQHHIALGTPEDSEISYFESLDLRFFILSLSGISALQFFSKRNSFVRSTGKEDPSILRQERTIQLIASLCFHTCVLLLLYLLDAPWAMCTWVIAAGSFYPFFNRLRQLMEHRSDMADKKNDYRKKSHGKLSRLFGNSLFDRSFGSAGFNRHLLHHLEPGISYTRLGEMEAFLQESMLGETINSKKTSYSKTFFKLLNR